MAFVHLAPNASGVTAQSTNVAISKTRSARSVAREHILRSIIAQNPARNAHSVLTVKWRSEPVCPIPTHSAWVSKKYKEFLAIVGHRVVTGVKRDVW